MCRGLQPARSASRPPPPRAVGSGEIGLWGGTNRRADVVPTQGGYVTDPPWGYVTDPPPWGVVAG
eukprot:2932787-Prymnesium_polylepis.2